VGNNPVVVAVVAGVGIVVVLLFAVFMLGSSDGGGASASGDGIGAPATNPLLVGDLAQVCEGNPAIHAGEYDPSTPGLQTVEVVAQREGSWSYLGDQEGPEGSGERPGAAEVGLVGCRRSTETPQVRVCDYDGDFVNMEIFWHTEVVELRVASTGELLASAPIGFADPGCPGLLMLDDGPQVDHYPDAQATAFFQEQAGDGTRPDLSIDEQVASICARSGGALRIADAPEDPKGPVSVVVLNGLVSEQRPDLAGPRPAASLTDASYLVCVGNSQTLRDFEGLTCDIRHVRVIRLFDGAVVTPGVLDGAAVEMPVCEAGLQSIGSGVVTAAHVAPFVALGGQPAA